MSSHNRPFFPRWISTTYSAYTTDGSTSGVGNPLAFFEIPVAKTALHAEVGIPATIPLSETALHAEAVIAATQIMESTMRAVFPFFSLMHSPWRYRAQIASAPDNDCSTPANSFQSATLPSIKSVSLTMAANSSA